MSHNPDVSASVALSTIIPIDMQPETAQQEPQLTLHRDNSIWSLDIQEVISGLHNAEQNVIDKNNWYHNLRRSRFSLLAVVSALLFCDMLTYGVVIPIIPLQNKYLDSTKLGVLFGSYSLGLLIFSPIFAIFSDKYKMRKKPIAIGLLALCASTIGFAFADSYIKLIVARILQGCAAGVVWSLGLGMLSDVYTTSQLGVAIGIAQTANALGYTLGPIMGGVLYQNYGYITPFLLCAGISAIVILIVLWIAEPASPSLNPKIPPPVTVALAESVGIITEDNEINMDPLPLSSTAKHPLPTPVRVSIWALLKKWKICKCLLLTVVTGGIYSGTEPNLPLYLQKKFDLSPSTIGLTLTTIVVPLFLSPFYGIAGERYGRMLITAFGILMYAVGCFGMSYPETLAVQILPLALFGFGAQMVMTPVLTELDAEAKKIGEGASGQVYALYNMAYGLGQLIFPVFGGILLDTYGFAQEMLTFAILLVAMFSLIVDWNVVWRFVRVHLTY